MQLKQTNLIYLQLIVLHLEEGNLQQNRQEEGNLEPQVWHLEQVLPDLKLMLILTLSEPVLPPSERKMET